MLILNEIFVQKRKWMFWLNFQENKFLVITQLVALLLLLNILILRECGNLYQQRKVE